MMRHFYQRLREFEQDCSDNGLDIATMIAEREGLPQEAATNDAAEAGNNFGRAREESINADDNQTGRLGGSSLLPAR